MTIDIDAPSGAVAAFLIAVAATLVVVAMDMRKIPFGKVKYVPWSFLTIVGILAVALAGKHAFDVLLPLIHG